MKNFFMFLLAMFVTFPAAGYAGDRSGPACPEDSISYQGDAPREKAIAFIDAAVKKKKSLRLFGNVEQGLCGIAPGFDIDITQTDSFYRVSFASPQGQGNLYFFLVDMATGESDGVTEGIRSVFPPAQETPGSGSQPSPTDAPGIRPETLDDAVSDIVSHLSEEDRETLLRTKKEDLIL